MTDKERILTLITTMTAHATTVHRLLSENSVKWEHIHQDTILKKGDIVCGITNSNHNYGVAFFHEKLGTSDFVVKEIGSEKLCNYTNEMFLVLRNFPDMYKLCGIEYKTMLKVEKSLFDIDQYRFDRVDFQPHKLIITLRKKWTTDKYLVDFDYSCTISKITIKSLKLKIEEELLKLSNK
jgi:hypothetical protein